VDSGKIGVFKERDEVSLSSFLESHDGGGLEAEVGLYTQHTMNNINDKGENMNLP
jgi:hypothetical protein